MSGANEQVNERSRVPSLPFSSFIGKVGGEGSHFFSRWGL
jgi:hypothetical protein